MRPRWEHVRPVLLTVLLVMALGVLWRTHQQGKTIDRTHAELSDALAYRDHLIAGMELQTALNTCNRREDAMSSVERDPCRLVCWSMHTDETLWTERLSEGVCEELR